MAKPSGGYKYQVKANVGELQLDVLLDTGAAANGVSEETVMAVNNHARCRGKILGEGDRPVRLER